MNITVTHMIDVSPAIEGLLKLISGALTGNIHISPDTPPKAAQSAQPAPALETPPVHEEKPIVEKGLPKQDALSDEEAPLPAQETRRTDEKAYPAQEAPPPKEDPPSTERAQIIKPEDLRSEAVKKNKPDVKALLKNWGFDSLSGVPEAHRAEFLAALRGL